MRPTKRLWIVVLGLALALEAQAQDLTVQAGRWLQESGTDWSTYRVGIGRRLVGGLGYTLSGTMIRERGAIDQRLWGLGADLTLFRGGLPGPYVTAGVTGGVGTGEADLLWGSWTAGVGFELLPLSFLSIAAEGRWREVSTVANGGLELGLSLGINWGGGSGGGRRPSPVAVPLSSEDAWEWESGLAGPGRPASGLGGAATATQEAVLMAALEAMGTPYRWGGNSEDGFDCSGLIQYAYASQGIDLPRRSVDQARVGTAVSPNVALLDAGDILTFSEGGGRVSHVGLYLGQGRFIHSTSSGVRISRLALDDPDGAWWLRRWVGARRVFAPTPLATERAPSLD